MSARGQRIARAYRAAVAANMAEEQEARAFRENDKTQLAMRFLRQRGFVVYSETVHGGSRLRFVIGRDRRVSARELIARAQRLGFSTRRSK